MPDEKLSLPCPEQVHERRRITPRQQFLQRLEPHRIGGVEPQFTRLKRRRLEDLGEPLVEPEGQWPSFAAAEPSIGIGMPCLVGEPGREASAGLGDAGRVVTAGWSRMPE